MTLPDNRVRLPSSKIDFATDVGITSQDHDNYPSPGGQARFDHMRMFLIGLLSQQSSYDAPTEYRDGTPWFDLNSLSLKIWKNNSWEPYSDVIQLEEGITLQDWYLSATASLSSISPELFFAGKSNINSSSIPIPSSLQSQISSDSRAFITINGLALDPREVSFVGTPNPTTIQLTTIELEPNDAFQVNIRRVPSTTFVTQNVVLT